MNTKRFIFRFLTFSIILIGIFSSCSDDFFETEIGNRIDPSDHYKSAIEAELSYKGCLALLQNVTNELVILDGLRSDMMTTTENADGDLVAINLHNISANNSYINPENFYKIIINVNEVLPNLEPILEKDREFDSITFTQYAGTLVTLRSWAYFMLAKLNGEVGLVDENLTSFDPGSSIEYLTKSQIIDKLINILQPFIDEENDFTRYPIDHYVLLGELYLEKNDYAKAIQYFKFAVDGQANQERDINGVDRRGWYMVNSEYTKTRWEDIFKSAASKRSTVISAVPYSIEDGQRNFIEEWIGYNYDYMVKPSAIIIDAFNSEISQTGSAGDQYRGIGVSIDTSAQGKPYVKKYSLDLGRPHGADLILYRAADLHLLLAEALNRSGDHSTALALLNNGIKDLTDKPAGFERWGDNIGVRGRAYVKAIDVSLTDPNVTEIIEDYIIAERAKELAFEGKRWFDLIRIAERRNDPSYLANKVSSKFSDSKKSEEIRQLLMNPTSWYLPLPKGN